MTKAQHTRGVTRRTRVAREAAGISQAEMADLLRVGFDTYRKYELRTPLPHYLIQRFCKLTGVSVWYLITGEPDAMQPASRHVPPAAAND